MDILDYVVKEALVVIPVLLVLGALLKKTPNIPDWSILWILAVVGIIITIGILGFNVDAFIQGILVTGGAVLGHQAFKQTKNRNV